MSDYGRRRQRLVHDGLRAPQHEQILPDGIELIEINAARPIRLMNEAGKVWDFSNVLKVDGRRSANHHPRRGIQRNSSWRPFNTL